MSQQEKFIKDLQARLDWHFDRVLVPILVLTDKNKKHIETLTQKDRSHS